MRYSPFFHVKMRKFAKMDFQEGLVAVLFTVKKEDPAFAESFYTFWRGLLGVKKEDHSFEWSSYTPKRF